MIANPIPWPNGARCACAITFDIDADSLIHIARPYDSHYRLYPTSMGRYGPEVAVPRILETYERFGIKQSFFVPGWCLEQYAPLMETILKKGHEIGHHGLLHEDPLETMGQKQADAFHKAMEIHAKICGRLPTGYRAPIYNITPQVIDLLIENNFRYDSSMMGDDIPYRLKTDKGNLWEIPVHWGCDDWPPFAHYEEIGYMMPVKAPTAALSAFWEEFEAQYFYGGFFMLIVHPFLTGRLARWNLVDKWLEETISNKKVWFAPLESITEYVENLAADGVYCPKTEHLPYFTSRIRT